MLGTLKNYWLAVEQIYTPFYTNTMKCDQFFHMLRFLQFIDNKNQTDNNDNLTLENEESLISSVTPVLNLTVHLNI
jgi:hypothetical protein